MSRTSKIAIGALVVLLAAAPFVPRGGDEDGAVAPSGEEKVDPLAMAATAGPGRVTPAMRAEIERVVDTGRTVGRLATKIDPDQMARQLVRCADLEGQRYCLHTGWTTRSEERAQARMARAARAISLRPRRTAENTGDLDALALLERAAALSPQARARAERQELTEAARSVAKVWLLRHQIQGVALPSNFLGSHPEARAPVGARTADPVKGHADYPDRAKILTAARSSAQRRSYWCGPTTMQMIAWGWHHESRRQRLWARRLHTTSQGTGISDMVRVVNRRTGFDRPSRAGRYIVLDISTWKFRKWYLLQKRHIVDYRAPLVLHPVLLKRFYPYLDDDASGHFQVGRGYDINGDKPAMLGYFEPWNQQRFDPSEPFISRVQWRDAYKSYRANRAHFQQNIGV